MLSDCLHFPHHNRWLKETKRFGLSHRIVLDEVGLVLDEVGLVLDEIGLVLDEVGLVLDEVGLVLDEVGLVHDDVGLVLDEVGLVHEGEGLVLDEVELVHDEVGLVLDEVGLVLNDVGLVLSCYGPPPLDRGGRCVGTHPPAFVGIDSCCISVMHPPAQPDVTRPSGGWGLHYSIHILCMYT